MWYTSTILIFEVNVVPKYNLNKKKWTKVVLLILALSFVLVPLVMLIVNAFGVFG